MTVVADLRVFLKILESAAVAKGILVFIQSCCIFLKIRDISSPVGALARYPF